MVSQQKTKYGTCSLTDFPNYFGLYRYYWQELSKSSAPTWWIGLEFLPSVIHNENWDGKHTSLSSFLNATNSGVNSRK